MPISVAASTPYRHLPTVLLASVASLAMSRSSRQQAASTAPARKNITGMAGKIQLAPFVTHTMGLDAINEAFDLMHEGKSIRTVIHY